VVTVLSARDALARLIKELPASIAEFEQPQVAAITALLDAFSKQNAAAIPFALTLVAKRLNIFRQLARLATRAAPSMNAADIAATPYALAVSMVLDRLEDKGTELRAALKNNRILVAKDLLTEIYDTEYALQARICRLDEAKWGMRLNKIMNAIAADVDAEVSKFPQEVGHVLESLNQRRRQSIADRLTHMASKGRDAFNSGVASCMKLIGQA
jgi:inorganic triphosphatase YgiF